MLVPQSRCTRAWEQDDDWTAAAAAATPIPKLSDPALADAWCSCRPSQRFELLQVFSNGRVTASLGSAPPSGRGGRRFKSCHSDHRLAQIITFTGTDCGTVSFAAGTVINRSAGLLAAPALGERCQRSLACRLVAVRRALYLLGRFADIHSRPRGSIGIRKMRPSTTPSSSRS